MINFTYLRFNISLAGNTKDGLFDLYKRAQKAFYQLKNQLGDTFYRKPALAIKLFDALVKPILLYCSDFWDYYDNIFLLSNSTESSNISPALTDLTHFSNVQHVFICKIPPRLDFHNINNKVCEFNSLL